MAKLGFEFRPTAVKTIDVARSYLLKSVQMPGGVAGRVLGQLGLSFGTQTLVGDLDSSTKDLGYAYVKTGFPYRRSELRPKAGGTPEVSARAIRNRDQRINTKTPLEIGPTTDKGKVISLINSGNYEQAHEGYNKTGMTFYIDAASTIKTALDEQNKQLAVTGRKLYILAFYNLDKGDSFDKIELPFIPTGMDFKPESTWVNINAFGRNSPPLQYLGGKDTLSFDIDWYSTKGDYTGVFSLCKKIESYSKADGYKKQPPVINLIGVLGVEDVDYVITSAPYVIRQFTGVAGESKIVPLHIVQTITLQRVSKFNPTWKDIQYKVINTTQR